MAISWVMCYTHDPDTMVSQTTRVITMDKGTHETAIEAALANDWDKAHEIVQVMNDLLACWIHAILHKIEGNASNSRYWYGTSGGRHYEDFSGSAHRAPGRPRRQPGRMIPGQFTDEYVSF
jgi:hypothetical protein